MYRIDLNSDLGESFGRYTLGLDKEIVKNISSVSLACGVHAGDPMVMNDTVILAKNNNCKIGAHPGFPDLQGFGRRLMKMSFDEVKNYVKYQIGALMAFTKSNGVKMQHVKAHGALGNESTINEVYARAICEAVYEIDPELIVVCQAISKVIPEAEKLGLKYAREVFADRAYMDDGTLVPRNMPGAVLTDENYAIERVIRMIKECRVESINGKTIEVNPDSVCVHGDSAMAVEFSKKIVKACNDAGIEIVDLGQILK